VVLIAAGEDASDVALGPRQGVTDCLSSRSPRNTPDRTDKSGQRPAVVQTCLGRAFARPPGVALRARHFSGGYDGGTDAARFSVCRQSVGYREPGSL
jgi:hypothetical protein